MIRCIGSDVFLNGKVVARCVSELQGGTNIFYLSFKSGRQLWSDRNYLSLGELTAAVLDGDNRTDLIIAAFTGPALLESCDPPPLFQYA